MTSKQLFQVFVYGTLKKGEPNHCWLTNQENGFAKFISNGKTDTQFPLIVATKYNIPFLLNVPETGHNVNGEIYSVDEEMLKNLDDLEDYPELYDRNIFNVKGSDGCESYTCKQCFRIDGEVKVRMEVLQMMDFYFKTHQCWIYMLKQFPDQFLHNFKFLSDYRNSVEQPYCESYLDTCTPEDLYNFE